MKKRIYFLFLLSQLVFINQALAETETKVKVEGFENRTHLSLGISNFMIKGGISRDFTKDFELALNAYSGELSSYEFKPRYCCMGPQNIASAYSVEVEAKNYFNRLDYSENFRNLNYLRAFIGTSFVNRWGYDSKVDGDTSTYYLGAGVGDTIYLNKVGFNFAFDVGLNTDFSYNAIAFIFFPRLLVGVETNF